MLSRQDMPRTLYMGDGDSAAAPSTAEDPRLAKMVQDMASFGLRSGEGEWKERANSGQRYEFFA